MRLHYSPYSSNSLRVLACAAELGVELDLMEVNLSEGAQRTPGFLAKNPNGKVPLLEGDDGLLLWESTAIINFLADTSGNRELYPTDHATRAHIHKWQSWTLMHFVRVTDVFLFENVIKGFFGLGLPDPSVLAKAAEDIHPMLSILDSELSKHPFLVGDAPTLADHHLFAIFYIRDQLKLPQLDEFPALQRWIDTLSKSKGWQSLSS